MISRGLFNKPRGESHPFHVLTDELVRRIRAEYKPRIVTQQILAERYNKPRSTIRNVLMYETWRHVL
jgi:ribosomal protein S25